jgi:hypothetical protein
MAGRGSPSLGARRPHSVREWVVFQGSNSASDRQRGLCATASVRVRAKIAASATHRPSSTPVRGGNVIAQNSLIASHRKFRHPQVRKALELLPSVNPSLLAYCSGEKVLRTPRFLRKLVV